MTNLLKHNDHIQFEYHDVYLGAVVATYRVYSVISDALACGANPISALKTVPEGGDHVQLRRVANNLCVEGTGALLLWAGRHVVVVEGQTYMVEIDGPSAALKRAGA